MEIRKRNSDFANHSSQMSNFATCSKRMLLNTSLADHSGTPFAPHGGVIGGVT
jgi:hypothetical protein